MDSPKVSVCLFGVSMSVQAVRNKVTTVRLLLLGCVPNVFLQPDGTYNWSKQQGQRNFLKLAKERGIDKFLAFLNSPPVYYTQNGLATNTGRGGTANLKPDCYEKYVRFWPM